MLINRILPPKTQSVTKIKLPPVNKLKLSNGIPVFSIHVGKEDVVKIQLVFNAGIWYQSQVLQAFFTGNMLIEGSQNFSAAEIAEKLDSCGAFVNHKIDHDNASVDIYTLNKHLSKVLALMADVIKYPRFSENELDRLREQEIQAFIIRNHKVKHIAQKRFSVLLFGENHPYGSNSIEQDYTNIKSEILKEFHSKYYKSDNCKIFISGKIEDTTMKLLDYFFGGADWKVNIPILNPKYIAESSSIQNHYIPKENVLQSAIRMGKRTIGKAHPDYFALSLTTTLLGGYFGSRLMSNIREDKGYTYGISAGIYTHLNDNALIISSEVGSDVAQKAIDEVRFELKKLRTQKVTEEELKLVVNYMSGSFLRRLNGAFALGEIVKLLNEYNLPEDYYQNYLNHIHDINSEDVLNIANQYLHEDSMIELIVGKN